MPTASPIEPRIRHVRRRHKNTKFGEESLGLGVAGLRHRRAWTMKREMDSQRATTHWDELLTVHAH
ncbi:DUF4113 domain-containing protein [Curtobacterium flaccumfaciens]|nr:DUF4113 domain-containing protein [Curtobacterium flaccumfaciens]